MYLYVMLLNAKQSIIEHAERACAFVVPTLKRMLCFLFFFPFNSRGNTCCCVPFKQFFKNFACFHYRTHVL